MTRLLNSENCIASVYEQLMSMLQTELTQYVANPVIEPVSFHIDFKKCGAQDTGVTFFLVNGTLNGKMVNLTRNNSAVLNYAFRIGAEDDELAKGLFKVRISESKGFVGLTGGVAATDLS